LQVLY